MFANMNESWGIVRTAELAIGLMLLSARYFLYEPEEGRLQNALVPLWLRIEDHSLSVRTRTLALLNATARYALAIYDRIFGPGLISWRAMIVSIAFALVSVLLIGVLDAYLQPGRLLIPEISSEGELVFHGRPYYEAVEEGLLWCLLMGTTILVAGSLPAFFPKSRTALVAPMLPVIALLAGIWYVSIPSLSGVGWVSQAIGMGFAQLLLLAAVPMIDLLWLAGNRFILKRALQRPSVIPHVLTTIVALSVAGACFYVVPYVRDGLVDHDSPSFRWAFLKFVDVTLTTRLFIAAVSFVQSALIAVALTHLLIWPFLSRVVYAAERFELLKQRKLFAALGAALVCSDTGATPVGRRRWPQRSPRVSPRSPSTTSKGAFS